MPPEPVDLRIYRQPLHEFMQRSIESFSQLHPEVTVSTVAICAFVAEFGNGSICFDTQTHSDQKVAKYQHLGSAWYGVDEAGRFGNSPADFAFPAFAEFELEGYPDLTEWPEKKPLIYMDHQGLPQDSRWMEDGDEGINRAVFPSLCEFVRTFEGWNELRRAERLRVGVVMHDSSSQGFWSYPV